LANVKDKNGRLRVQQSCPRLDVLSYLSLEFVRAHEMDRRADLAEQLSRFRVHVFWGNEQNRNVMGLARDEHVVEKKLEHGGPAVLGGYDLVQVAHDYIYFPFDKMVNRLSMSVPSIRYW